MDAQERWRILRLHVEDQIPIATLARDTGISSRTLQRWNHQYRDDGIAGLEHRPRVDKGTRRTDERTVAFIERLALTRPRPALATLHRLTAADANQRGTSPPSYATVRDIVRALNPALVTLALEGPASYRDGEDGCGFVVGVLTCIETDAVGLSLVGRVGVGGGSVWFEEGPSRAGL